MRRPRLPENGARRNIFRQVVQSGRHRRRLAGALPGDMAGGHCGLAYVGYYLSAAGLLIGVAILAAIVPALRAARLDPVVALRHE